MIPLRCVSATNGEGKGNAGSAPKLEWPAAPQGVSAAGQAFLPRKTGASRIAGGGPETVIQMRVLGSEFAFLVVLDPEAHCFLEQFEIFIREQDFGTDSGKA